MEREADSITLTNCCYFPRIDASSNFHTTVLLQLQAVRFGVSDLVGTDDHNSTLLRPQDKKAWPFTKVNMRVLHSVVNPSIPYLNSTSS